MDGGNGGGGGGAENDDGGGAAAADYDRRGGNWGLKLHQCSTCPTALLAKPVPFGTSLNPEEEASFLSLIFGREGSTLFL